jgi:hypothetical protein
MLFCFESNILDFAVMSLRNAWLVAVLISANSIAFCQVTATKAAKDADSVYIRTYVRSNDIRAFYGGQGNGLVLGSLRDGSPGLAKDIYRNTNDFIGLGISYKWLDGDLYFSLPGSTYLKEERSNLDQFKLAASHTRRKVAFRGYLSDSRGVIVAGDKDEYQTSPTIHEFLMGLQATYIFNERKYSYRASLYQSEVQRVTAGSFLIRGELFFRSLGGSAQDLVPEAFDTAIRFGDQVGLTYIKAPGFVVMPGYGVNFAFRKSKMFISPILLAGAGTAFNYYKGYEGKGMHVNMEYSAYFSLNAGYNGTLFYSRVQCTYAAGYSPVRPSYLTSTNLTVSLLCGYRFRDLKMRKQKSVA